VAKKTNSRMPLHYGVMTTHGMQALTTKRELTFCRICFSLSAIASPFRFLIRFFSSFLHAYIFPVARTWHAHTSPKPPFPSTRYMRNVYLVTGWLFATKTNTQHLTSIQSILTVTEQRGTITKLWHAWQMIQSLLCSNCNSNSSYF